MALEIRDPELDSNARALAERLGTDPGEAIRRAIEGELRRSKLSLSERLRRLAPMAAAR